MSQHQVGFVDWIRGESDETRKLVLKEVIDVMEDGENIKEALEMAGLSAGEPQVVEKEVIKEVVREVEVPLENQELDDDFVVEWLRKQKVQDVEKIIKQAAERYLPERGFMNFFKRGEPVKLDLLAPDGTMHDVAVYPQSVGKERVVLCLKRKGATGSRRSKTASRSTSSSRRTSRPKKSPPTADSAPSSETNG